MFLTLSAKDCIHFKVLGMTNEPLVGYIKWVAWLERQFLEGYKWPVTVPWHILFQITLPAVLQLKSALQNNRQVAKQYVSNWVYFTCANGDIQWKPTRIMEMCIRECSLFCTIMQIRRSLRPDTEVIKAMFCWHLLLDTQVVFFCNPLTYLCI